MKIFLIILILNFSLFACKTRKELQEVGDDPVQEPIEEPVDKTVKKSEKKSVQTENSKPLKNGPHKRKGGIINQVKTDVNSSIDLLEKRRLDRLKKLGIKK
jgi:hypothetical protein